MDAKLTTQFFLVVCATLASDSKAAIDDVPDAGIGDAGTTLPAWEPILTPWWDLTFGEGEQLVVDCGVYTGGDPLGVDIGWMGPNGKPLPRDRRELARRDKNKAEDTKAAAYSVLTMTLSNLTLSDSGVYACVVNRRINGKNETKTVNITLTVVDSGRRCGFESETLCGWTIDSNSDVRWHVHTGRDSDVINRTKGTHFDHTYGASKDIGHFLDVDVQHYDTIHHNATAKLISPLYKAHNEYRCLQFWYIFEGRDQTHLKVSLLRANDSYDLMTNLWKMDVNQNNGWQLSSVNISPQEEDYHLIFDAAVCFERCSLAASAVDDIMITNGKCNNGTYWPDNSLRVRLIGGSSPKEGQVEVLHDGQWGTICSDQFGQKEAKVICKSLGYSTDFAERRRNAHFSANSSELRTMIWLEKLACSGKETDLAQCIAKGEAWAQTDCSHQEDAGVICSDVPLTSSVKTNKLVTTVMTSSPMLPSTKILSTTRPSTAPEITPSATTSPKIVPITPPVTEKTTNPSTAKLSPPPTTGTKSKANSTMQDFSTPSLSTQKYVASSIRSTTMSGPRSTKPHYVTPTASKGKTFMSTTTSLKTTTIKVSGNPERKNPDIVSLPPEVESYTTGSNAGVAIGIIFAVLIAATGVGIVLYRRRRKGKKSTYITFGNPSYSREHLPANDFSLESPLTLSSNGYTVLA